MPAESHPTEHLWIELNVLNLVGELPGVDGARIARSGTVVHDLNGEPLFLRVGLEGCDVELFADSAIDPRLGAPLLAFSHAEWDPDALLDEAAEVLRRRRRAVTYDEARFVAYSYPKLALQFLRDEQEVALLELYTWRQVPPARERKRDEPPGDFERWSFLEELPPALLRRNAGRHAKRVRELEKLLRPRQYPSGRLIKADVFADWLDRFDVILRERRELHYAAGPGGHQPCYELRGQQTNVWCVAASVQMVLDFYRYNYAQTRLAAELGLGTLSNPGGLPYGNEQLVVDVLENLTSNALGAGMNWTPSWTEFRDEIRANRPLISFIPGHSRTVAGFTRSGVSLLSPFRGLLVYDPWPPNAGVITRWENFDSQTYRVTFNARLTLV